MLTFSFCLLLALLALYNYIISKTFLYPPFLFSSLWSVFLMALFIAGDKFYALSFKTLSLYFLGALSFSVGGFLIILRYWRSNLKPNNSIEKENRIIKIYKDYFINISLIIILIALPFYYRKLMEIGFSSRIENIWSAIRFETVYGEAKLGLWSYFIGFTRLVAGVSYLEFRISNRGRTRTLILILLSLIYDLFNMARTGAFYLIFILLGEEIILKKKINYKSLLIIFLALIIIFSVPAVLLEKGGGLFISLKENVEGIFESMQVYMLAGIVAFDNVANNPAYYAGPRIVTFRFMIALLDRLGLIDYQLPKYITVVTYTPIATNVYTIYFPYYLDFGVIGVIACMIAIGSFCSFIFVNAYHRKEYLYIFLYGMVVASMCVSSLNEAFITALSYWLQSFIFVFFFYCLPGHIFGQKRPL